LAFASLIHLSLFLKKKEENLLFFIKIRKDIYKNEVKIKMKKNRRKQI
jgi:hypothetical protein